MWGRVPGVAPASDLMLNPLQAGARACPVRPPPEPADWNSSRLEALSRPHLRQLSFPAQVGSSGYVTNTVSLPLLDRQRPKRAMSDDPLPEAHQLGSEMCSGSCEGYLNMTARIAFPIVAAWRLVNWRELALTIAI
jgi:hypothetical protein